MNAQAISIPPHCAYCGKPLNRWLEDHWGTKFCPEHQGQYPRCQHCGRLVPPQHTGGTIHNADRVICPICRASAIDHLAQAKPIFSSLVEWINGQGLLFNNLQLRIELRNRQQLAEFLREPGDTKCLGATLHTTYTLNGRATRVEVNGVAILRGLPSVLFQAVTIHELGHAWLAVHGITSLSRQDEEGFCEFLAHRYLTQVATRESLFHADGIARNPDPIYGEGYRLASKLIATAGFQGILSKLQSAGCLP